MPEEAPVIRTTGRLDGGWDSTCTCTAYEAGGGLVGTKCLLYWPLSWHLSYPFVLDLFASWSSNLLSAARRCFCQVIMAMVWLIKNPRRPSKNPLFKIHCLQKAANGETSSRPTPPFVGLEWASMRA